MSSAVRLAERPVSSRHWGDILSARGQAVVLAGAVACALLLRLSLLPHDGVINEDGTFYATLGRSLKAGDLHGGISAYWSPFYPALIGLCAWCVADLELAGRLVSVIAGSLLVIPTYLLICESYGRAAAGLGTALVVAHPLLLRASGWVMTEAVYGLLFATIVVVGWHAVRAGRPHTLFLAGLLVGAAYLTRPEAVGYLGLLCAFALGGATLRRPVRIGVLIARPALVLAGFALLALPYVAAVHEKTGHWTLSQKFVSNVAVAGASRGLALMADGASTLPDLLFHDGYAVPGRHGTAAAPASPPVRVAAPSRATVRLKLTTLAARTVAHLRKQLREHIPAILPVPLALVALVGLGRGPWTRTRAARELWLLAFVGCTIIGYALTVVELRYMFVLIPIFAAWTARGTLEVGAWASRAASQIVGAGRAPAPAAFAGLVALVLAGALAPRYRGGLVPKTSRDAPFEEKDAGLWLRSASGGVPVVMASSPTVAFYANARHLYVPDEPMPMVLAYARRKRVDYLVYSERRLRRTPRAFPDAAWHPPPELRLVYDAERLPGYRVSVYALSR